MMAHKKKVKRERKGDGKFWLCDPYPLRSLASWCSLNNPKPPSPLPPPRPLSSKASLFYGASVGEDPEVKMIGLLFPGFANMWPLPAGLHPPESQAGVTVPTTLC